MAAIPQESKGISQMLEDMRSQNPIERIGRKLQLIFIKITYLILRVRTSRSFFGSPCLSLTVANPRPE
jgi:hypothetical protein